MAHRYAGPFREPPMKHYVQSPIGLVPKANNKTRLIFHLSFNFGDEPHEQSINHHTPQELCTVKYNDLDHAVKNCLRFLQELNKCSNSSEVNQKGVLYYSKTDCSNAFRIAPTLPSQCFLLIMCARHPKNGKKYFFVDKCLPFGASRSCAIFQAFSDGLRFIAQIKIQEAAIVAYTPAISNYLDDFLFIALCYHICKAMLQEFLRVCQQVNCPISDEKTEGPEVIMVFLGTLLNGFSHSLSIPEEKVNKAMYMLKQVIDNRKVTIRFIQQLTGTLNFLNRTVVPGRAFTRGLYAKLKLHDNKGRLLLPYHHMYLNSDFIQDCLVWVTFLKNPANLHISRPFVDFSDDKNEECLFFYSDASKNENFGIGAVFNNRWIVGRWTPGFIKSEDPSIEFLELIALVAALYTWKGSRQLNNGRVRLYCDNQAVVAMINTLASSCSQCRKLIRLVALLQIQNNIRIFVNFVRSRDNGLADSLSRMDYSRFSKLAGPSMSPVPDDIPSNIWPVERIWSREFNQIIKDFI